MNTTFIGLGIMGLPMSKNLYKKNYLQTVYNRTIHKTEFYNNTNVEIANSPKDAAKNADIIFIMVSDSSDVKEIVLGENGIIHTINSGSIVVDMSSINPEVTKRIAEQLRQKEAYMIDAPVSGGEQGAINGELAIMVGGKESHINKVHSHLDILGKSVVHIGPLGSGGYAKLINQIIVGLELEAIGEAFTLASKAGISFEKIYKAIRYGLAGSNVLDQKIGNIIDNQYEPGFKINLHLKDIRNALCAAEEQGIQLPVTKKVKSYMEEISKEGLGEADHSIMYSFLRNKKD